MSTADVSAGTGTEVPGTRTADVRLEVVLLGVSDVDRAKRPSTSRWAGGWTPMWPARTTSGWFS